jgi:hypothetical protein
VSKVLGIATVEPAAGKLTAGQARDARDVFRASLLNGTTAAAPAAPVATIPAPALDETARETFRAAATKYIAAHTSEWTPKEGERRARMLAKLPYADRPWIEITAEEIAASLTAAGWVNNQTKPGSLYRSMTERVIGAAVVRAKISHGNPAVWSTQRHLLPNPPSRDNHHAAIAYADLPAFLREAADSMLTFQAAAVLNSASSGSPPSPSNACR